MDRGLLCLSSTRPTSLFLFYDIECHRLMLSSLSRSLAFMVVGMKLRKGPLEMNVVNVEP